MPDPRSAEIADSLCKACVRLLMQKQYTNALLTSFVTYIVSLDSDEPDFKSVALRHIEIAMREIREANGDGAANSNRQPACSFCGSQPPDVNLVAGPNVFICSPCSKVVRTTFKDQYGETD